MTINFTFFLILVTYFLSFGSLSISICLLIRIAVVCMTFKGFLHYGLRVTLIKTKESFTARLALKMMPTAVTTKMLR